MYTTYQYRVTVYNDYGHTTSLPSAEVTTFGGTPTRPPIVTANTVNHTSIEISWSTPSVQELQGGVTQYVINVTNPATSMVHSFTEEPGVAKIVVPNLIPNTMYEVLVTIVIHGGATITSEPSYITTRDGGEQRQTWISLFVACLNVKK